MSYYEENYLHQKQNQYKLHLLSQIICDMLKSLIVQYIL